MAERLKGKRKFTALLVQGSDRKAPPGKFSIPQSAPSRQPIAFAGRPTEDLEDALTARILASGAAVAVAVILVVGGTLSFCGRKNQQREDALNNYVSSSIPYDKIRAVASTMDKSIEKVKPDKRKAIALTREISISVLSPKDLELDSQKKELKTDLGTQNPRENFGTFYGLPGSDPEKILLNDDLILLPLSRTGKHNIKCVDGSDIVDGCNLYLAVKYSFDGQTLNINDLNLISLKGSTGQIIDAKIHVDKSDLDNSLRNLLDSYWRITRPEEDTKDLAKRIEEKENENAKDLDRHKQRDFTAKLERGMLKITTKMSDWGGGTSMCSAWIAAPDVMGTAKHCMVSGKTERMLLGVDKIVTNGTLIARSVNFYMPKSESDYIVVLAPNHDLAAIVLRQPVFKESDVLQIRNTPVVENGKYFAAHFAGYDFPQIWKVDRGGMQKVTFLDKKIAFGFDFSVQGGNSGGPIVDYNGDVISLFALGDKSGSYGPHITRTTFNGLVREGKERLLKLEQTKKTK